MQTNTTPDAQESPRRNDPSTWCNSHYPLFVVQALPRDKHALELDGLPANQAPEVFRRSRCRWYETDTRSYCLQDAVPLADGTTKAAQALRPGDELGGPSGRPQRATAVHITRHVRKGEAEALRKQLVRVDSLHVHLVELPENEDSTKEPIEEERVEIAIDTHRCAGTTKDARSWVRLDRRDALHAIYAHYLHANLSICRFRSGASGDYAADLVFEIDAHAEIPAGCELEFFHPYIGAAVSVGRRIYNYLTSLKVDPRYITASISRMGARVTVDWRAFGPRRLQEILLVIRWVESQVFAAGDLAEIAKQFGIPKVEIDARAYSRSDAPRPTPDETNGFIGPWLRPVGALHSKSSNATWWYRTTPVPHDRFTVENTAWLTAVSRANHPDKIGLELGHNHFLTWPEARHPRADRLIETNPCPSHSLIDLFERDDLLEQLGDDYRAEVTQAKQRACGTRIRRVGSARDVDEETIKTFVALLGVEAHEHTDKWQLDCPRTSCKAGGLKAAIYKDAGTFTCFRCSPKGLSLWHLASELGLTSQLPTRANSTSPVQWVPKEEAPAARPDTWTGPYIEVHEPECATIEEVWSERERLIRDFQSRDDARVLIDISATGLGKSEAARRFLGGLSSNYRVLAPRDDIKAEYQVALPMAVTVDGRRLGVNCVNDDLEEVTSRGEPVAQTLCSTCPHRGGCVYFAQLKAAKNRPTILSHAHGPFTDLDAFDNDAAIDVVDEDALDSVILAHDLDEEELGWFKTRLEIIRADDGEEVGLDTPAPKVKRTAASERIGVLVDRLAELLMTDSITSFDAKLAANQEIADLQLGRLLFRDAQLREAIKVIDDADLDAHEAARLDLLDLWRQRNRPLGVTVPAHIEATWKAPQGSPIEQLLAWLEWAEPRLQVIEAPNLDRDQRRLLRRPKAVLRQLVEALRNL